VDDSVDGAVKALDPSVADPMAAPTDDVLHITLDAFGKTDDRFNSAGLRPPDPTL